MKGFIQDNLKPHNVKLSSTFSGADETEVGKY